MLKFTGFAAGAMAALVLVLVSIPAGQACTGIRLQAAGGAIVYARTLEFGSDLNSQVLFLPRNYEFTGTTASGKPGLTWSSTFAAIGLNGYGYNVLIDGVNERGLAAGTFYMPGYADYESVIAETETRAIAPWEVVTWILTNFSTVDEVREALSGIKVAAAPLEGKLGVPPLHYVAHDRNGNSLVIEYVDGRLTTFSNPIGVITNSPTFDWHLTNLRNYINLTATNVPPVDVHGIELSQLGQGSGLRGLPGDFTPPSRFVRAVALAQATESGQTGADAILSAFHVLDSFDIPRGAVRPGDGSNDPEEYTQWTSACDLQSGKYCFHTYGNRRVRMVDLTKFDAEALQPVRVPLDDSAAIEELEPEAAVQ